MNGPSGTGPNRSVSWEIIREMTTGTLATTTRRGPRVVGRVAGFWGSFYLRHSGRLAGFSINLELCGSRGSTRRSFPSLRGRTDRTLFWEAVELSHPNDRDFSGKCRLRTADRKIFGTTSGKVIVARSPSSDHPYFKIMMTTDFRGLQLNWPSARYLFNRIELCFFTEIHQRQAGAGAG